MAVEMAIVAVPALVLVMLVLVFLGRSGSAKINVEAAAAGAARAASLAVTPDAAAAAVRDTVAATTVRTGWRCTSTLDRSGLHLGGQATVDLVCRVPLTDLGLPGISSRTVHASATQPIEIYRTTP